MQVFESLNELSNILSLAWNDPSVDCLIQVDASGTGLGATLLQNNKLVAYASRVLTPIERRYARIPNLNGNSWRLSSR